MSLPGILNLEGQHIGGRERVIPIEVVVYKRTTRHGVVGSHDFKFFGRKKTQTQMNSSFIPHILTSTKEAECGSDVLTLCEHLVSKAKALDQSMKIE
jgi:hypothetical protein